MAAEKYHIEYVFKTVSASILWRLVATAQGLEKWYADACEERGDELTFWWGTTKETARILKVVEGERIRFRRDDDAADHFFEFQVHINSLTKDVTLSIIDFAEEDEVDDAKMLWNKQVEELCKCSGI